jgi:putative N6-adenine-specific DNA methylase
MGKRPNVNPDSPDLQLHLHISDDRVSISIDSSGESLHNRGYRSSGHISPLNEVLAAGMIMLSGWTKEHQLMDPMCGSGTVPIEGAMMASNTPAGFLRQEYAFMKWRDYDEELWTKVKAEADAKIDKTGIRIKASDFSGLHVRMARTAAIAVGLDGCIEFEKEDFFELDCDEGFVIMNPPYGERMTHTNIEDFYEEMADHLKRYFAGCQCWLISSNNEALLRFGLKPSKRIVLFNGPFQCLFQKFELYAGSKKSKYKDGTIDQAIRDYGEPREEKKDRPFKEKREFSRDRQQIPNERKYDPDRKPFKPRTERPERTERPKRSESSDSPPREKQTKTGGLKWTRETPRDKRPFQKDNSSKSKDNSDK